MKYGYFDDERKEYVITNPKTPVKWINYIGDLNFGGFVDHTGGALLCKGDPALNRITKYIPQLPSSDFKGTTLYIRFHREKDFTIFSPFFVPTIDPYQRYECHVGLGYTRIVSELFEIQTEVTIFVPIDGVQEIRDILVTNSRPESVEIDLIPVVEYTHPNAVMQFTNADWIPQTMQSKSVAEPGGLVTLFQYPFMHKENKVNYFTSNRSVTSFETDRKVFLGDNEYGSWKNPLALQNPELSNTEAYRGDNIAALMHHLGILEPGETKRLISQLGQSDSIENALVQTREFRDPSKVDLAIDDLKNFWEGYTNKFQIATPDPGMNQILNIHNPRQIYITKNWSRYLSLYQLGFGSRGIGTRDTSQDIMGIISHDPEGARELIRKLLSIQHQNGSAMHSFNPLTMEGSIGDSHEIEDRPKYYSDDHLWLILAVCSYLKETGDHDLLNEVIPFYEKDKHGHPVESGTVFEHLNRAIEFTENDKGDHGLPLAGFADWNDTVNLRTGAESLFTANLYGKALLELISLVGYLSSQDAAEKYQSYYDSMKASINLVAWDGEWYVRYFDVDGTPLGSKTNQEGKIFTNAQSWSVISGFASPKRARMALESVHEYLNTPKGIKLSTPGYDGYDPMKGGVSTYPPGAKENGGIFLHTNPWVIIAETMVGNGNRAYEYYSQINPAKKNESIDEYECEPYVYAQNLLGDEHPQFGLARNHWLTGTASWIYQAATQYILGIRPGLEGLMIDPCIPNDWSGFKVERYFRGSNYWITVENPNHVSNGVKLIIVDGNELTGNVLPDFRDGKDHSIYVTLG